MRVELINGNKKRFLDLLLLADEQESMVDKYLDKGTMFAIYDDDLKGICVVTKERDRVCEIKNIATYEKFHGQGYGKKLIDYVCDYFKDDCDTMFVGTGDSPLTVPFYKKCGFVESHRIKNFFTDNYDHLIFEAGKQLVDMVYLKKEL
ncbi:GNAT family N-acetyltransferase [Inconstantimicrobium porci]|uniref:GNAT family N-acetyltransferase n=1 Tax=Inconstantimicrobium porci TaxID=2652291 RepID=UPI00240A4C69|nr:GNAT family N-acetyltransferase [Inconstantimicrobium porci]MDD6769322.1 GNAT family N-acetyltransferase [Inconstantimicrobium porci]